MVLDHPVHKSSRLSYLTPSGCLDPFISPEQTLALCPQGRLRPNWPRVSLHIQPNSWQPAPASPVIAVRFGDGVG